MISPFIFKLIRKKTLTCSVPHMKSQSAIAEKSKLIILVPQHQEIFLLKENTESLYISAGILYILQHFDPE